MGGFYMVMKLTLYSDSVAAGFPSPAEDYKEDALSLDEHLITHPAATYLAKASGDSMQGLGIFDQDLLIVDRSLTPRSGSVVVAAVDGELCCKQIDLAGRQLLSANEHYPPIAISDDQSLVIEGVVKASIRYHWKG
jgi:DNA polymerase V